MSSDDFTHQYANLKGVRIHFVTIGQGAPVVLIHGWPQTWFEWRRVMPLLADKFSLVAVSLKGNGDSSRPRTGYDKKTVANDVWQLMHDHLGQSRFAVVGHDWGAPVAFRLAADHPAEVTHLALLDLPMPTLGIGGGGPRGRGDLVIESLRRVANRAEGGSIADCGHFIPEEKPEELARRLREF